MYTAEWALVVALLSFVIATSSLAWQVFIWTKQRADISVEAVWAALSPDRQHTIRANDQRELTSAIAVIDPVEYPTPVVCVTVRNGGRAPMAVEDAGVMFPSGHTYRHRELVREAGVPRTLQPGEAVNVSVPIAHLFETWAELDDSPDTTTIRGTANLGNGQSVTSKPLTLRWADVHQLGDSSGH
jgi:hypothetical protein